MWTTGRRYLLSSCLVWGLYLFWTIVISILVIVEITALIGLWPG